jgi:hypothetical protein
MAESLSASAGMLRIAARNSSSPNPRSWVLCRSIRTAGDSSITRCSSVGLWCMRPRTAEPPEASRSPGASGRAPAKSVLVPTRWTRWGHIGATSGPRTTRSQRTTAVTHGPASPQLTARIIWTSQVATTAPALSHGGTQFKAGPGSGRLRRPSSRRQRPRTPLNSRSPIAQKPRSGLCEHLLPQASNAYCPFRTSGAGYSSQGSARDRCTGKGRAFLPRRRHRRP